MKKNIFINIFVIVLSLFPAVVGLAGPVDVAKAKELARKYISSPVSVAETSDGFMAKSRRFNDDSPALHMFNNQNGEGFVIVAADDRVGGVLGYSDKGSLDTQNMPAPLMALLTDYTRAVEAVRVDSISVTPYYIKPPKAFVKPLVSAEWSQDYPYNYYTPRSSTSGKPTYTGCTITAMAQVLFAHRWPKMRPEGVIRGEGAMAYDYYDWDNMLDSYSGGGYSEAQGQAVGVLMRDLGKLAQATYGVNGTLCDEGKLWNALQYYYNCSVRQLEKDRLPGGEFLQAIYQELSLGCPVFMTGGDHAFLYDGYDENGLVHVNWGWAGLDNGYFDINTAATAGGGYGSDGCYYENQIALFVHPNDGMIEPLQPKPVVLSVNNDQGLQFQASEGMTVKSIIPAQIKGVGARNLAQDAGGAYTGQIGIGLFTQDGRCMHVFGKSGVMTWATYYTSYNFEFDWWRMDLNEIDGLADGTYYLRPLGCRLLDADKGVWEDWKQMVNGNTVPMIVSQGEVTLLQADNKPHLSLVGLPEVLEPAYQYSSQLAGILLNISNLSRYQARGELQVELEGTGNLAGETYLVPNAYLAHMVAQRMDTTQWLVRFMTSYTGTTGSHDLKAGKYRMKLRFNHNIETKNPAVYDIPVPEDFLLEVYPNNYEGRVTVTSVKLLDDAGNRVPSYYFNMGLKPQLTLGMSGYMKYLTQGSLQTRMRYRLVNVATGETTYTSGTYRVSIPRNNDTDLTGSTRHQVNLTELAEGTYEIHVDIERDGMWLDRWNANTFRRRITLYKEAPPTRVLVKTMPAEQIDNVSCIAAFGAPFDAVVPSGVEAWYIKQIDNDELQLVAIPNGLAIPAGTGVLLTSSVSASVFEMERASASVSVADLSGNLLRACIDDRHTVTSEDHAYVLDNGECQTAFYRCDVGEVIPRYSAWLQSDAIEPVLVLSISNNATAVAGIESEKAVQPAAIYGLDGRKSSSNSVRGIYIVNGRKMFVPGK